MWYLKADFKYVFQTRAFEEGLLFSMLSMKYIQSFCLIRKMEERQFMS